jgi:hypothetical protein
VSVLPETVTAELLEPFDVQPAMPTATSAHAQAARPRASTRLDTGSSG